MGYWEELKEKIKGKEYVDLQQVRYRNEQTVAMKVNGMPVSTNRLKTDYTVERSIILDTTSCSLHLVSMIISLLFFQRNIKQGWTWS